jgi:hypothetical protein
MSQSFGVAHFSFNGRLRQHIFELVSSESQIQTHTHSYFTTDGQSASVLMSNNHLGPKVIFLLLRDYCKFVYVGRPLWRKEGSVIYMCGGPSPAQSFLGTSLTVLMTAFYCLSVDTSQTRKVRSPYFYLSGTGWPSQTPRHWALLSSPLTTRRATVEVSEPASRREPNSTHSQNQNYITTDGQSSKSKSHYDR